MRSTKNTIFSIMALAIAIISLSGCSDTLAELFGGNEDIHPGDEVMMTSMVTANSATRAVSDEIQGYKAVNKAYAFKIGMYVENAAESSNPVSEGTYKGANDSSDGTLTATSSLYWPDTQKKYGFKATAGSETLQADQSSEEKLIAEDKLLGYGYEPVKFSDSETADNISTLNYHTAKEWKKLNEQWHTNAGEGLTPPSDYKKIPLFLQHQRALITVILVAGDGVERKDVLAATAKDKIEAKIYSYANSSKLEITPLPGIHSHAYADNDVDEVACYSAVVEPYNYSTNKDADKICSINLSGQKFSFYAGNDKNENNDLSTRYNLAAGDNLVITAILSRESRKIRITAYIQPWTDVVTSEVCNDFGMAGDPIQIATKDQLVTFLSEEKKNAPGNVAVIMNNINLDETNDWSSDYDLKCMLNLNGKTLTTKNRIFNDITDNGSFINGYVSVKGGGTNINTIVCNTNKGAIDRIVLNKDDSETAPHVTIAGFAETNNAYITNCTSYIPVKGEAKSDASTENPTYIGGICGVSVSSTGTLLPCINNCYVDAKVDIESGHSNVKGGGIVGKANGKVTNNTFYYGITLKQDANLLHNIIFEKAIDTNNTTLTAQGNQWPTKVENTDAGENNSAEKYDAVIDCQAELAKLVDANSTYNVSSNSYRLSDSFTVLSSGDNAWELGKKDDNLTNDIQGNVLFILDGNNKTITLDGNKEIEYKQDGKTETTGKKVQSAPMLFCNIAGEVRNLNIHCANSLYGLPVYDNTAEGGQKVKAEDVCAPLAFAVAGGTVKNVKVTAAEGKSIVAANAAGLVVWAYDGAKIENCTSMIGIESWVPDNHSTDHTILSGGLVSQAADVTITQCQYAPPTSYSYNCYKGSDLNTSVSGNNIFLGGIVGGVSVKKIESTAHKPNVTFADCSSWYSFTESSCTQGAIIGKYQYNEESKNVSGVNTGSCEGNWWPSVKAVGEVTGIGDDQKIIGRKNSVEPTRPEQ